MPVNIDTSGVPVQKHYDSTVPLNFEAFDLDGFKELKFEYHEGSSSTPVWSETQSSGTKFEKSWLPSADGLVPARLEWAYVDANPDAERGSGSLDIQILDTRFAEGSFAFRGRFGGDPNGYFTVSTPEKKKISTLEIIDGVVNYDRSHRIDADSLDERKLVHLTEASGYVTQRAPMSKEDGEIVPWKAQDWDSQVVLDHLMDPVPMLAEQGALHANEHWPIGSEIDVLVFDEQYFVLGDSGLEATNPVNSDYLPNQRYIDGSISAYSYLDALLPQIKLNIKLQSESEEAFPQKIEDSVNKIFVGAWPNGESDINRSNDTSNGAFTGAFAMQRTDSPYTGPLLEGGILSDATENFGSKTSYQNSLTVDLEVAKLRPIGKKNLLFRYDRPIGSGEYHGVGVPGHNGLVDVVPDYISE